MNDPVVVVGLGQMGAVFSHALLRAGHPVFPVPRGGDAAEVARRVPRPALALVSVGEGDLPAVLDALPDEWRDRAGLLQNELLPADWEGRLEDPTVAVVWFEKKAGRGVTVIRPTPVAGPFAAPLVAALGGVGIAAEVARPERLVFELVVKNLYILTVNLAGLAVDAKVGPLWHDHADVTRPVLDDVLALQEALLGAPIDRAAAVAALAAAIDADPAHGARGRSAPARLRRALSHADRLGLAVAALRALPA